MGTREGLTDEHFVPVEHYPLYEVSNFGRIVNVQSGHELQQKSNKAGELVVTLSLTGKRYAVLVGRLVAEAFFVDFTEDKVVSFLNGDKHECTVMNITLKERV